jgi:acetylornithine deacetylase/succinyl-diaminopimelate desuccinylase-like protein
MIAAESLLADQREAMVAELKSFIEIPSVSTDPAHAGDVQRAAEFVAKQLVRAGLSDVRIHPTEGHPIVTASWRHRSDRPTILIYGHFDVQPPDPLAAWQSPPFVPVIRNNRLYGRGASDDKGPLLIPIKVVAALLAAEAELPVNVVFLLEGEEEIGSAHLGAFIEKHRALLSADFVLSADGAQWRPNFPSVITGSRGLCALEVSVESARKDLHSGRHGGAVANPIQKLVDLLASLHRGDGAIAVTGFYDRVIEPSIEERQRVAAIAFDEAEYLASIGAEASVGEVGYSLIERNWLRPTLEFNGIYGGYTGPGKKTVIPSWAGAKITCRLVPDQNPVEIAECIVRHLRQGIGPDARLSIHVEPSGAWPYTIRDDHRGLILAKEILAQVTGQTPVLVRMGATIPIGGLFKQLLGIDTIFFSFATADEDYHAPNEFFRLSSLGTGLKAWTQYLHALGRQSCGPS